MQAIIDKLDEERERAERDLAATAQAIADHKQAIGALTASQEELEDEITAAESAIALLTGKQRRRRRRKA